MHTSDCSDERRTRCRIIVFIVALGFVTSTYYHYWLSAYLRMGYPVSTYLFKPDDRYAWNTEQPLGGPHIFGDLLFTSRVMRGADPYHLQPETRLPGPSNYPPFMHIVTWFFHFVPYGVAVALFFTVTLTIAGAFFAYFFCKGGGTESWLGALILTTMSYPVQFILDRGNVEIFAFGFVALFCFYYFKGRHRTAAVWLGLAAAAKIFPAVYGLIFLAQRRWKAGFTFLLTGLLATVASGMLLKGGLRGSFTAYHAALASYADFYDGRKGMVFGWSMHGAAVCAIAILQAHYPEPDTFFGRIDQHFHLVAALPALGLLLAGTVIRGLKLWERLTIFGVLIAFAPVPTPDYRLIQMLVPIAAFLNQGAEAESEPSDAERRSGRITALLFALTLIPWAFASSPSGFHEGVILRPLILLVLCYRILIPHLKRWRIPKPEVPALATRALAG